MTSGTVSFDRFTLDPANRLLRRDGAPVELSARYLDALSLMVRHPGGLVSKDRFLDEVWHGVPVTDEALTQCIKTLRRQLGDDASAPRFIETVPKHGYRFIAPVERMAGRSITGIPRDWRRIFLLAGAGTIGGGLAGLAGGLFFGLVGAAQPLEPGMGAVSILLVLVCLTILVATIGSAGVALGIAAADGRGRWVIVGGAVGGLVVGAAAKLLGLDAFNLLLGQSPGDITGAREGLLLGGGVGFGAWLAQRSPSLRRAIVAAALAGGAAGLATILLGGRLMGGSLYSLAGRFPGSRLRLDQIGAFVGERGFGPISQAVTGALEGALFAACLVGAMTIARRDLDRSG